MIIRVCGVMSSDGRLLPNGSESIFEQHSSRPDAFGYKHLNDNEPTLIVFYREDFSDEAKAVKPIEQIVVFDKRTSSNEIINTLGNQYRIELLECNARTALSRLFIREKKVDELYLTIKPVLSADPDQPTLSSDPDKPTDLEYLISSEHFNLESMGMVGDDCLAKYKKIAD